MYSCSFGVCRDVSVEQLELIRTTDDIVVSGSRLQDSDKQATASGVAD